MMKNLKIVAAALCVLSLVNSGSAQEPARAMPKAKSVLERIPGDSMAFMVIKNVKSATDHVDQFLNNVGLAQMAAGVMPDGALATIKAAVQLGDGFNPNGGFAVVLLNPGPLGIDLAEMIPTGPGAEEPELKPELKNIPLVLLVPGTGIKKVFGEYEMQKDGKYTKVSLRMGEMYAAKLGGYIALSPAAKFLDALKAAKTKASTALPELRRSAALADVAIYVNMKLVGPIYMRFFENVIESQEQSHGAGLMMPMIGNPAEMLKLLSSFYDYMFSQMKSVTIAGRLAKTGVVLEETVTFVPGSRMAKLATPTGRTRKPRLNRLPNLPYVLAMSTISHGKELAAESRQMTVDMIEKILTLPTLGELDDKLKVDVRKVAVGLTEQIQASQFVFGGSVEGSGVFGLSLVLDCKDAAKTRRLLAKATVNANSMIKAFGEDQDMQEFSISYKKGAETVGKAKVDVIEIGGLLHDEEEDEDQDEVEDDEEDEEDEEEEDEEVVMMNPLAGMLGALFGEKKIRIRIAAADDKRLVITFGGSTPFLEEALRVAKGRKGTIGRGPQFVEAMRYMPRSRTAIMLLDVGGLLKVVRRGVETFMPGTGDQVPQLTNKKPIAYGVGASKGAARVVIYVPNDLIKELVNLAGPMLGGGMMQEGGEMDDEAAPGDGDF